MKRLLILLLVIVIIGLVIYKNNKTGEGGDSYYDASVCVNEGGDEKSCYCNKVVLDGRGYTKYFPTDEDWIIAAKDCGFYFE
jgi:hypothetical protein